MYEQRQALDFLRRRYAAAIMQDDMDTACRLRLQLDAIMNRSRLEQRHGRAPAPHQASDLTGKPVPAPGRFELRIVDEPETGLREIGRGSWSRKASGRVGV